MTTQQKGFLLILASAIGFAFLPTITRSIYAVSDGFLPTDIAFWRFTFATSVIWGVLFLRRPSGTKRPTIAKRYILLLGTLYAISALLAFFGLEKIDASLFVVLFYTYPAMVAVLSLLMGVRLPFLAWVALGMTLAGIVLTVPDLSRLTVDSTQGIVMALLNGFSVALYFIASGRLLHGVTDMLRSTAWTMGATWLVLASVAVLFFGVNLPPNLPTLLHILLLSIVGTVIPIFGINAGIQYIGATKASIISSVEPVIAMVLAMVLLGEKITPLQWFGAILIVMAVIVLEAQPKR